jgi:hypothetical protein
MLSWQEAAQYRAHTAELVRKAGIFIVFRNHGLWPWVSGYAPAQLLTNCLSPYGGLPKAPCFARGCLLCFHNVFALYSISKFIASSVIRTRFV